MPSIKMKTHKGVKKRFKVSATGKVSHKRCGSSHLNSHKSGRKIRKLRTRTFVHNQTVARRYRHVLGARENLLPPQTEDANGTETTAEDATAPAE